MAASYNCSISKGVDILSGAHGEQFILFTRCCIQLNTFKLALQNPHVEWSIKIMHKTSQKHIERFKGSQTKKRKHWPKIVLLVLLRIEIS